MAAFYCCMAAFSNHVIASFTSVADAKMRVIYCIVRDSFWSHGSSTSVADKQIYKYMHRLGIEGVVLNQLRTGLKGGVYTTERNI